MHVQKRNPNKTTAHTFCAEIQIRTLLLIKLENGHYQVQKQQHLILSQEQQLKSQAQQNEAQARQISDLEIRLQRLEAGAARRQRTRRK